MISSGKHFMLISDKDSKALSLSNTNISSSSLMNVVNGTSVNSAQDMYGFRQTEIKKNPNISNPCGDFRCDNFPDRNRQTDVTESESRPWDRGNGQLRNGQQTRQMNCFGQSRGTSVNGFGQLRDTSRDGFGQPRDTSMNDFGQPRDTSMNCFRQPRGTSGRQNFSANRHELSRGYNSNPERGPFHHQNHWTSSKQQFNGGNWLEWEKEVAVRQISNNSNEGDMEWDVDDDNDDILDPAVLKMLNKLELEPQGPVKQPQQPPKQKGEAKYGIEGLKVYNSGWGDVDDQWRNQYDDGTSCWGNNIEKGSGWKSPDYSGNQYDDGTDCWSSFNDTEKGSGWKSQGWM